MTAPIDPDERVAGDGIDTALVVNETRTAAMLPDDGDVFCSELLEVVRTFDDDDMGMPPAGVSMRSLGSSR